VVGRHRRRRLMRHRRCRNQALEPWRTPDFASDAVSEKAEYPDV